jgi:hypothetical protein
VSRERRITFTDLDERTQQAIHELQSIITARYPTTTFELVQSPDDQAILHLLAVADVEDPDEVGDLVVERVVSLQVEEGIPLHVIPLRTPERIEEALAAGHRGGGQRTVRLWGGVEKPR